MASRHFVADLNLSFFDQIDLNFTKFSILLDVNCRLPLPKKRTRKTSKRRLQIVRTKRNETDEWAPRKRKKNPLAPRRPRICWQIYRSDRGRERRNRNFFLRVTFFFVVTRRTNDLLRSKTKRRLRPFVFARMQESFFRTDVCNARRGRNRLTGKRIVENLKGLRR